MQYVWKEVGPAPRGVDAQAVGEEIEALGGDDGVTPAELVEAARKPGSSMHDYFEWDDKKAADAHRLNQARYLLRTIAVVVREDEPPVRAFHAVVVEDGEGDDPADTHDALRPRRYVPVSIVAAKPSLLRQVLDETLSLLIGCQKRYAQYQGLAPVMAVIEAAVEQLGALRENADTESVLTPATV